MSRRAGGAAGAGARATSPRRRPSATATTSGPWRSSAAPGRAPPVLVRPRSAEAVAAVVRSAAAHGRRVAAYGAGDRRRGRPRRQRRRRHRPRAARRDPRARRRVAGGDGRRRPQRRRARGSAGGGTASRSATTRSRCASRPSAAGSQCGPRARTRRGTAASSASCAASRSCCPTASWCRCPCGCALPGGLDLAALLTGSEGWLGIVTAVSLDVRRRSREEPVCASFDTLDAGLAAQRELVQGGYRVALLRLYNAAESAAIVPEELRDVVRCLLMVRTAGPVWPRPRRPCRGRARRALGGTLLPEGRRRRLVRPPLRRPRG